MRKLKFISIKLKIVTESKMLKLSFEQHTKTKPAKYDIMIKCIDVHCYMCMLRKWLSNKGKLWGAIWRGFPKSYNLNRGFVGEHKEEAGIDQLWCEQPYLSKKKNNTNGIFYV